MTFPKAATRKIVVGNVEIIPVVDTPFEFPLNIPFPDRSADDFAPYRDLYPKAFNDDNLATQACGFAVRSEGKTILCDTGLGPGPIEMLGGVRGRFLEALNESGVTPDSVDIVFHTHIHVDHVGWNLNRDNVPNFRNARYLAPQADWDAFSSAPDQNPQMRQLMPLKDIDRLDLYSGERALTSEVTIVPTPGHTPGHSSLAISSAGEKAFIMGDLAHHPAQVNEVGWCVSFDMDRDSAMESRRRMFDEAEHSGARVAFGHFREALGTLVRSNGRRLFQAL